ncbi:MAG: porin [Prevotella sp.]|nr:porin [Prevotella sp.]MBQ4295667.1 porin [Prevotella sp.]MBR7053849.1 porin [Prevotella sp.]
MRKQSFKSSSLAVALAVFSSVAAMGQRSDGQSIDWLKELTNRIEVHGYAQGGYSYDDNHKQTNSTFNLKRTLFWAKARVTDRFSFLFMHDFSSVVQEYYLDYRFSNDKSLNVRLGQFKHSYSMENPLSPTMLELIDVYSQAVLFLAGEGPDPLNGVNYGRDLGMMVYGDLFNNKIHYELALMNGQGINRKDLNSDKDLIVHLEYKPTEHFRVVGTAQKGRGHAVGTAAWNPGVKQGDNYRRDRVSLGAEWKSKELNVRAEYLGGKDGDVDSYGGYVTASVPIADGLDIVASADYYDRNTDMDYYQTNLTGGIQYWFYKKCRLQLQYTRCLSHFSDDYNWLQAQVQVAF